MNSDHLELLKKLWDHKFSLWEKEGKSRIYVEDWGYLTLDSKDVRGRNSGELNNYYYQATRPGHVGKMRDVIRLLIENGM
jgi:hypothetical protein